MTRGVDAAAGSTRTSALLATAAFVLIGLLAVAMPASSSPRVAVTITTPREGATLSGSVPFLADVSGNARAVEFYIDDELKWTEQREPWAYNPDNSDGSLDTRKLGDGPHKLKVVAKHPSGATATAEINVTVTNDTVTNGTAPTVSTASPSDGATVSGTVTWEASVEGTVTEVVFLVDGAQKWVENSAPYRYNGDGAFDTTALANGSHVMSVRAEGPDGSASSSIDVSVANGSSSGSSSGGTTGSPPANTTASVVSGTTSVGQTLSATMGTWTGSDPISYARAWERCVNGTCTAIAGATGATYQLVSGDAGATLRHVVTATNSFGSEVARSAQTATVQVPVTTPPANLEPPMVSGTAAVGQTLSATLGTWVGSPTTYVRAWERCLNGSCAVISGATGPNYTLTSGDAGASLRHAVTATGAAGSTTARSAPTATVQAAPQPTATGRTYSWGFDAPNCSGDVWARSSWLSPSCSEADWNMEGVYYSVTDPDKPTRVLRQDASGVDSTGTWQGWVHTPLTVDGSSWGTEHRVDIDVKLVRWGSQAQSICSWAGGPKIFMGRPQDVYETSTYTIELAICDGSVHIQKKEWGISECGQDPRAVDCGAGGTWYLLAQARPGVPSFGTWHRFTAIKRDNADGSITLIGMRDGVELLRYTEQPNDLPLGPLRGGREGWRSNAVDWRMDSYTVTVK